MPLLIKSNSIFRIDQKRQLREDGVLVFGRDTIIQTGYVCPVVNPPILTPTSLTFFFSSNLFRQ